MNSSLVSSIQQIVGLDVFGMQWKMLFLMGKCSCRYRKQHSYFTMVSIPDNTWRISLHIYFCALIEADTDTCVGTESNQIETGLQQPATIRVETVIKVWIWKEKIIFCLILSANTFVFLD